MVYNEYLTGFRFIVSVGPLQMGFQRLSGISRGIEVETYQEGGVYGRVHIFPKPVQSSGTLTLQKGVAPLSYNPFSMVGERLLMPLIVIVLDSAGLPGKTYTFSDCIVKSWRVGDLNADENALLIDSFEVAYADFMTL